MSAARRGPPVELRRHYQTVQVRPAVDGLDRHFGAIRHVYTGRGLGRHHESLLHLAGGPDDVCWSAPAGLEAALAERLRWDGFALRWAGDRPADWGLPAGPVSDAGVVDLVRRHDRGLVWLGPAVAPARLVAQMARAYPARRLLVAAVRTRDAYQIARHLDRLGVWAELFAAGRCPPGECRVAVATTRLLAAAGAADRDLVLAVGADEWFDADGRLRADGLAQVRWGKLVGLLPAGRPLAPRSAALVTAAFGPHQVRVSANGLMPRSVKVRFEPITGGGPVDAGDALSLKRTGLWGHGVRTRRLAARFRELAGAATGTVALLAENLDQALALSGRLPGVPVVAGRDTDLQPDEPPGIAAAVPVGEEAGRHAAVIVTYAGLPALGDLDTLVRADGGTGLPPLPAGLLAARAGDARPLTVWDAADRHHPVLRRQAAARRAAYRAAGWAVEGGTQE